MNTELLHGYLNAGRQLSPIADWAVDTVLYLGPGVLFVGVGVATWEGIEKIRDVLEQRRERQALRRTPAADDNQAGTNATDLWTCRRIEAEPLADPDASRRLITYLRDTGEEEAS